MLVLFTLLFAVSSTLAYLVTFPNANEGWNTTGPNYLEWQRVDTDPLNFTVILVNSNNNNAQTLGSLVDGTTGSTICNPPTEGWVAGSAYRVNLDQSYQSNSVLAQSGEFNITAVPASSTTSSLTTTSTTSGASTTSSTKPTGTSAATLDTDARAGLFTAVVVLTVLTFTFF